MTSSVCSVIIKKEKVCSGKNIESRYNKVTRFETRFDFVVNQGYYLTWNIMDHQIYLFKIAKLKQNMRRYLKKCLHIFAICFFYIYVYLNRIIFLCTYIYKKRNETKKYLFSVTIYSNKLLCFLIKNFPLLGD